MSMSRYYQANEGKWDVPLSLNVRRALATSAATTPFSPQADPATTAPDGSSQYALSGIWSTTRNNATGNSTFSNRTSEFARTLESGGQHQIRRVMVAFDTSSLTDTDTVDSAQLQMYVSAKTNEDNDGFDYVGVIDWSPASSTSITNADYGNTTFTKQSDTDTDIGSITTSATNNFDLNSTGIGNIDLTGVSSYMIDLGHSIDLQAPATGTTNRVDFDMAEGTNDPVLSVTHSAGGGGGGGSILTLNSKFW